MSIENKLLSSEFVHELRTLEEQYFTFDKPVPFKEKLSLHPIMVENYNEFINCSACCTVNKNDSPEGITMTQLDYLIFLLQQEKTGNLWTARFSRLMELVFHIRNGMKCEKCGKVYSFEEFIAKLQASKENTVCDVCGNCEFTEVIKYITNSKTKKKELWVDGTVITSKEYERLRQVIMYQNFPDYKDDSKVNLEIRQDQQLKQELLAKQSSHAEATLEKKIVCVSAASNYKLADIYQLSMRKFLMLLSTIDDLVTYQSDRMALSTGMVKSSKPLEHWIYKSKKSLYGDAVSSGSYSNKINSAQ